MGKIIRPLTYVVKNGKKDMCNKNPKKTMVIDKELRKAIILFEKFAQKQFFYCNGKTLSKGETLNSKIKDIKKAMKSFDEAELMAFNLFVNGAEAMLLNGEFDKLKKEISTKVISKIACKRKNKKK